MPRRAFVLVAVAALLAVPAPAFASPPAGTVPGVDYCLAQCLDILPPGQNGNATFPDILANKVFGMRPGHSADQLARYQQLGWDYRTVTDDTLQNYFNAATLGAPAGGVESVQTPRSDVVIYREKATGVPHVRGTTRAGTMFGAGYASAGDRLFLMDVLRHVGRGELTSFAGGSAGNRAFEQEQFAAAPYTESDLQKQFDQLDEEYGQAGAAFQADGLAYVAGINQYLADIKSGVQALPGEYTALGKDPSSWKVTDVVATAALVGGIFGKGGGGEVASAVALVEAKAKYGDELGTRIWQDFRSAEDPEAPVTVQPGRSFPYGQTPAEAPGRVLPDRGSVAAEPLVTDPTGTGAGGSSVALPAVKPEMSNALLVSGANTLSGHPVAVFGPQTGYFAPQLLLELDLQGPGISARGVAFAGLSMYVLLGRGQDYAWSATSAGQDITDSYAPELCEPGGGTPTIRSMSYRFRGQCLPIEVISKRNDWTPSTADGTAAGGYTLVRQRTKLGLVTHRGLVGGTPVAFTSLRSTYLHEPDSGIGFSMFNDPAAIGSAAGFTAAASRVGYAFNWFYADSRDIAYVNSGANPVRAPGADPSLPNRAEPAYEWRGWDPAANVADYQPMAEHPQAVNQDWFTSWNNKQARGTWAADDQFGFGPVFRSKPLDDRLATALSGVKKLDRAGLVRAMQDAATVDLRGDAVLPLALRVIGDAPTGDPAVDSALAALRTWAASGAHRSGMKTYDYPVAIRIMDAWWQRWISAQFAGLGPQLYGALTAVLPIDDPPGHAGSAFQHGWYGYANKDLRTVLGDRVQGPYAQAYCGDGNRSACRELLIATLKAAAAVPPAQVYPADNYCGAGDQYCHDQIVQAPIGGIGHDRIQWQNRPTFQQVVEFPARRGQDVTNRALGRAATASGTENGNPPSAAVDGDPATRWASGWEASQWLTVDLGGRVPVGRAVLDWESAYGREYQVQLSDDAVTWRTAAAVTGGNGGRDVVSFTPCAARYVRVLGTVRGTNYGYSLWELAVYSQ